MNTGQGMERSIGEATETATTLALAMKIRMKDRRKSTQGPAESTMENTLGANVHSTRTATIGRVTTEGITTTITEEIRAVKEIQMQTRGLHQAPIQSTLMRVEI